MTTDTATRTRELDSRSSGGIHVRLLWCELDRRVLVSVTDTRQGEAFSIAVREDERAADVFHHPYAYAAHRGIKSIDPAA